MKKLNLLLMVAFVLNCYAIETNDTSQLITKKNLNLPIGHGPQKISPLQKALNQADILIDQYINMSTQEIKNILNYMHYYRSWYQAVTPAPYEIYNALNSRNHSFIYQLQEIAQPLEKKTTSQLAGASSLSQQGDRFYTKIIEKLENMISVKELEKQI